MRSRTTTTCAPFSSARRAGSSKPSAPWLKCASGGKRSRAVLAGVARRWAVALIFALVSAWAAGAGYAFVTKPWEAELTALRARTGFAELVEHRVAKMTRTERRQFDALMKWGDGQ